MRKLLALMFAMMMMSSTASAYGFFWYDMKAGLENWKKVVIFPLANSWEPGKFLIDWDETSQLYWENKLMMEQFEKKIKNMHTVRLSPDIREKGEILTDKYSALLVPFDSERERAAAVFERTGADMYLLPTFKLNKVQAGMSPRAEMKVERRSWQTDIVDGQTSRVYNERTRLEHHIIPSVPRYMTVVELEIDGYDAEANKVLTFTDARRAYDAEAKEVFADIVKYIRNDFADVKSGKRADKGKDGTISIGFKNLDMPAELSADEFAVKGIYFATKIEALDNLEEFRIITDGNDPTPPDYYVTGVVTHWQVDPVWETPFATVKPTLVNSETQTWMDAAGQQHTKQTLWYEDEIQDHLGIRAFAFKSGAFLQLVDARTGEILIADSYVSNNDKMMDAYRDGLRVFYKEVREYFKEQSKA